MAVHCTFVMFGHVLSPKIGPYRTHHQTQAGDGEECRDVKGDERFTGLRSDICLCVGASVKVSDCVGEGTRVQGPRE